MQELLFYLLNYRHKWNLKSKSTNSILQLLFCAIFVHWLLYWFVFSNLQVLACSEENSSVTEKFA